jgi:hypothetical protein
MATDPNDPDFAEGQDNPEEFPEDEQKGRFSEGQEDLPEDAEQLRKGRFSEGVEELSDEDPEKHIKGSFADEDL